MATLPQLTGTDKQIDYATTIRAKKLTILEEMRAELADDGEDTRIADLYLAIIAKETRAHWYINADSWACELAGWAGVLHPATGKPALDDNLSDIHGPAPVWLVALGTERGADWRYGDDGVFY